MQRDFWFFKPFLFSEKAEVAGGAPYEGVAK
jgi:hypothetical protein